MINNNIKQRSENHFYHRVGIGLCAQIKQSCHKELTQLVTLAPMMIRIIKGTKLLTDQKQSYTVYEGQVVIVPANQVINITNLTDQQGEYEAEFLNWQPATLQRYITLSAHKQLSPLSAITILHELPTVIFNTLQRIRDSFCQSDPIDDTILQHQMIELLLWLETIDICLINTQQDKLAIKIRKIIAADPSKPWKSPEIAAQLAMSESTLRRHLLAEKTNLTEIIADVRMNYGLTLLQTTCWPINHIALEVGYESSSRFSIRFRQRFGISPMEIRGKQSKLTKIKQKT